MYKIASYCLAFYMMLLLIVVTIIVALISPVISIISIIGYQEQMKTVTGFLIHLLVTIYNEFIFLINSK